MNETNENKLMPKLRFPEFLDDGEWNKKKLGEVYFFITTNSFSRDNLNYVNGEVKNIHYGDIHTKFSTLFDISKENVPFINDSIPLNKFKQENYCKEGDMIFADASEDMKDIGKSIEIVNIKNEKLLSGLHTLLARQINSEIVVGFGGYLFSNDRIKKQIQRESQGAKVLGISATRLSNNINIFYPKDKTEQQKIADCLSSLDEVITTESQKLKVLKEHKKGLLQNLFPQAGEIVPKLRFEEFAHSGDWEERNLGKVGDFIGGGTPDTTNENYWDGDILWFTPTEVKEGNLTTSKRKITSEGLKKSSAKLLPVGALLITTRATIGDVGIATIPCTTNQGFQSLVVNENHVNTFWYYWILNNKSELKRRSSGSTFPEIGKNEIAQILALSPIKQEQQKIADCLSSLDDLINAQTQKVEALKLHKKGLLQGLFPQISG